MNTIFGLGGFLSAIFCAALLLRRRRVQALLRSTLQRFVLSNLVITYEAPSPADEARSQVVFDMLYNLLVARLQDADEGPASLHLGLLHGGD